MNIKEKVSIHFTKLTKTDRKITSQLLIKPEILINQPIQAAAVTLDVSPAAIMRVVKKLEYRGLAEFKLALEEINGEEEIAETSAKKQIISEVIDSYRQTLNVVEEMLDEAQLQRIVQWLSSYPRVRILGLGSSGLAAEQFVYSLLYQDEYVESITSRTKIYYLARAVTPDTFLMIYTVSGNIEFYKDILEQAREKGAKVVLVTMNHDEVLRKLADEVVLLPSNITNFSNKNGLIQLDNRYSFYIFSEILATYFESVE
ncbi:MurR/RpiR family transcriptional regulator [Enterococcus lemanii]|uniref:MurR/RpiR family transcriptional regulator n=1 Tax=Enterococcus lemanii TaxID=1159752 RepID=A0ABV9MUU0_9ENTE|nr:MurR/RpiR family transcriptional regulator [Enterococcus lemanii]MBM7710048.1 DNA-binding MurR/RpiR family transcriptional regulator [Enterococcus lemanii]